MLEAAELEPGFLGQILPWRRSSARAEAFEKLEQYRCTSRTPAVGSAAATAALDALLEQGSAGLGGRCKSKAAFTAAER